jgi:predicted transcriptional regulator
VRRPVKSRNLLPDTLARRRALPSKPELIPHARRSQRACLRHDFSIFLYDSVIQGATMKSAVTIRLDSELERRLDQAAETSGKTRSEIVREALRRQLALLQFEHLRGRVMPFAEARGYLTDEDVFRDVS